MCVIIVATKNKIDEKTIREAFRINDDGAGIAWREGNKVKWIKGLMKVEDLIKELKNVNNFPHIVHCRAATSGGKLKELTHPFPCDGITRNALEGQADAVLFHNGVVHDYEELILRLANILGRKTLNKILEYPSLSDTLVIAEIVGKIGKNFLKLITGKWVYFTPTELTFYGSFIKKNGFYYSNLIGLPSNEIDWLTRWKYDNFLK
jgi:glucosamine 6-phosphate synthetase-like amidotransferase/phosphosugar isomerase protein